MPAERPPREPAGSQPNQSLADGLRCLHELALAGEPLGCRELARRLDLHPVRANRLLKGLVAAGMARQDPQARYLAGPALPVLGAVAVFGSGLLARALPALAELQAATAATVALGVRWRDRVCYLYHGAPGMAPEQALGRTALHPVLDSSIGIALLAGLDDARIDAEVGAVNAVATAALAACRATGHARLQHGAAARPHLSLAVAIGAPAHAGIACTGIALDAELTPVLAALHHAAERIGKESP
jgi:DNA-binding IclR family transcriptional regulator